MKHMKRIIQMSLMLYVCLLHMKAQTGTQDMPKPKKNSIYLEGSGNGFSYGTYRWIFGSTITVTTLPAEIYFSDGKKSCLELGLGYTSVFEENNVVGMITFRSNPHLYVGFSF